MNIDMVLAERAERNRQTIKAKRESVYWWRQFRCEGTHVEAVTDKTPLRRLRKTNRGTAPNQENLLQRLPPPPQSMGAVAKASEAQAHGETGEAMATCAVDKTETLTRTGKSKRRNGESNTRRAHSPKSRQTSRRCWGDNRKLTATAMAPDRHRKAVSLSLRSVRLRRN